MKRILVIGAGRSSTTLIDYLNVRSTKYNWELTIADQNIELAKKKVPQNTRVIQLNVFDESALEAEVVKASVVVSMLPARFHPIVALACLKHSKSLLTASYESDEVNRMATEAKSKGITFLNELGVDPGIDHISAMNVLDRLRNEGHAILGFESFTGGLIAPESDNNPWNYKFTWNPRNVVLAGQGGPAKFIQDGKYKYIPYNRLFRRTETIEIMGYGSFEGYANRDSLKYVQQYNLQDVPTVYRGTLRRPGYCRAWDVFVQLGATDDTYTLENSEELTYKEFINSFLYFSNEDSVKLKLYHYMHIDQDSEIRHKLEWLNIFSDKKVGIKNATPAQVLQKILSEKWTLEPNDKDMIVMWHKFDFIDKVSNKRKTLTSSMGVLGDDPIQTAMSKTVGLPLGIACKMLLTGQIDLPGVHIPTKREIYQPILCELEKHNITFKESYLS